MITRKENNLDISIEEAAYYLSMRGGAVAFTGAGISVESGIPPFRGEGGLWNKVDPRLADHSYALEHPKKVWGFFKKYFYSPKMLSAQPNKAHYILADWESKGFINAVITQNVDDLHQAAGSKNVIELHGNLRELRCEECDIVIDFGNWLIAEDVPYCPSCNRGILRPNATMFGEDLPQLAWSKAEKYIFQAPTLLIIGTTGEVSPANTLPQIAFRSGKIIVEINPKDSIYTHSITNIVVPLKASEGLEKINALL